MYFLYSQLWNPNVTVLVLNLNGAFLVDVVVIMLQRREGKNQQFAFSQMGSNWFSGKISLGCIIPGSKSHFNCLCLH